MYVHMCVFVRVRLRLCVHVHGREHGRGRVWGGVYVLQVIWKAICSAIESFVSLCLPPSLFPNRNTSLPPHHRTPAQHQKTPVLRAQGRMRVQVAQAEVALQA